MGNDAFEDGKPNVNYPLNAAVTTVSPYFTNPAAPTAGASGFATGLPTTPGVSRNSFDGPGYQDVDATVTKSFGFPKAKVIGDHANLAIRADAFNSVVTNYLEPNFGQAQKGLSGRIVNLQARFSF
jgi:hypothetical protein